MKQLLVLLLFTIISIAVVSAQVVKAGDEALGTRKYADYEKPEVCGASCHVDFYQQWKQAMMSQAYTHHWDEIEYFKLAVPHAEKAKRLTSRLSHERLQTQGVGVCSRFVFSGGGEGNVERCMDGSNICRISTEDAVPQPREYGCHPSCAGCQFKHAGSWCDACLGYDLEILSCEVVPPCAKQLIAWGRRDGRCQLAQTRW